MNITYDTSGIPGPEEVIHIYERCGLPRPTRDKKRIQLMFKNAGLVVTARDNGRLVGVCRSITDWVWCCYLADLAVDPDYKQNGIGKALIDATKEKLGGQVMILLLSVPTAMEYYPKVGFEKESRAFMLNRTE
jgi:predicted N-acetyltransferase YhbS